MQLTKFTDYCLRVLIYLSTRGNTLVTVSEISKAYGVSHNHLMKVAQHLSSKGYVEAVRGKKGGIRLTRAPGFINLGEVVRDCEQSFAIVECFNPVNTKCPLLPACVLRATLKEATKNFLATLDRYTVADLVRGQGAQLAPTGTGASPSG